MLVIKAIRSLFHGLRTVDHDEFFSIFGVTPEVTPEKNEYIQRRLDVLYNEMNIWYEEAEWITFAVRRGDAYRSNAQKAWARYEEERLKYRKATRIARRMGFK